MGISSGHTTYRMISSVVGTLWDAPWFNKNEGSSKKLPVVAKDGSWKIEAVVKQCPVCQESRPSPPLAPLHPRKWPSHLWSCIHLDCDGQYMSYRFLVIVDAHSKWLDAHIMSTITLSKMIESATIGIYDLHLTPPLAEHRVSCLWRSSGHDSTRYTWNRRESGEETIETE